MKPEVRRIRAWSGTPIWIWERVVDGSGTALTTSTCSDWAVYVFDTSVTGEDSVLVAEATEDDTSLNFYDTLQTDVLLNDGGGYNFEYIINSDLFTPEGGKTYRVEFKFNSADVNVGPIFSVLEIQTAPILNDSI